MQLNLKVLIDYLLETGGYHVFKFILTHCICIMNASHDDFHIVGNIIQ